MVAPSVSVNKNMWYVFEFVKFMGGADEKMVNPPPPPPLYTYHHLLHVCAQTHTR